MIEPIKFTKDWEKKPIYFMGQDNPNEIVITKNDKQYVVGNQLYFKYKDINIYADLDSLIYINTKTDIIQIKKYKELTPPNNREYLVLLVYYDEQLPNTFQGIIGRQETFDFIKSIAEEINMEESLILTETVEYRNAINIYDFMKECIMNKTVNNDDGFDIDEYIITIDEEETT